MFQLVTYVWEKVKIPLFILSALVPIPSLFKTPADPLLPIYSIFVLVFIIRKKLHSKVGRELNFPLKFALAVVIVGLIAESLAWSVNFLARSENPGLFHPQLVYDLIIGLAMYTAWAIVWFFWSKRYQISLVQVFITQGLFGVFLEQRGVIFLQGLFNMPTGLLLWADVFLIYGSIPALAYLLSNGPLENNAEGFQLKRNIVLLLTLTFISLSFQILWEFFLKSAGFIPNPLPIWQHPFW